MHIYLFIVYICIKIKDMDSFVILKTQIIQIIFFFRMGQILKDDESVVIIIKTISVSLLVDHHEM